MQPIGFKKLQMLFVAFLPRLDYERLLKKYLILIFRKMIRKKDLESLTSIVLELYLEKNFSTF